MQAGYRPSLVFYSLYMLFWINEQMFRRTQWRDWLWFHMRLQLFVINGGCQHSGNCCRSLMLVQEGNAIDTTRAYDAVLQKMPTYSRFVPLFGKNKTGVSKIQKFRCTCLTAENKCNDYANRPRICHQYPMSMFIKLGYIHAGCGYKVQFRGFYPYVRHPVFWSLVFRAMRDNRLSNACLQRLR
jgi:uncharacterized protein